MMACCLWELGFGPCKQKRSRAEIGSCPESVGRQRDISYIYHRIQNTNNIHVPSCSLYYLPYQSVTQSYQLNESNTNTCKYKLTDGVKQSKHLKKSWPGTKHSRVIPKGGDTATKCRLPATSTSHGQKSHHPQPSVIRRKSHHIKKGTSHCQHAPGTPTFRGVLEWQETRRKPSTVGPKQHDASHVDHICVEVTVAQHIHSPLDIISMTARHHHSLPQPPQ